VVVHAVAVVERVPGRHEQVARQPPGDQQRAERDVLVRLGELRMNERRDHVVRELGAHQRVHRGGRGLLGPADRVRAEHALRKPEGRADRDRRGHQREHREERHLRGMARRAVRLRAARDADQQRPRP
jgi:hypothetical protein